MYKNSMLENYVWTLCTGKKGEHMKKVEGTYYCYNGLIVTQLSVLDIVNDSEDKQIRKLIKRISERNKYQNIVKVTISLEMEEGENWMEGMF